MDFINLAQGRDRLTGLVNAAVNSLIPHNAGNLLNDELLAPQGPCSMELVFSHDSL
jgi:hypothetical protein